MVPSSIKIPVPFDFVFPNGALFLSIDKLVDFDRIDQDDNQARDEHGTRIWVVKVMDQDPEAGRFGRTTEVKVKLAAAHQPVPPEGVSLPGGSGRAAGRVHRHDRHALRRQHRLPGQQQAAQVPGPAGVVLPGRRARRTGHDQHDSGCCLITSRVGGGTPRPRRLPPPR